MRCMTLPESVARLRNKLENQKSRKVSLICYLGAPAPWMTLATGVPFMFNFLHLCLDVGSINEVESVPLLTQLWNATCWDLYPAWA